MGVLATVYVHVLVLQAAHLFKVDVQVVADCALGRVEGDAFRVGLQRHLQLHQHTVVELMAPIVVHGAPLHRHGVCVASLGFLTFWLFHFWGFFTFCPLHILTFSSTMSIHDEIALHYASVAVPPDGDCWINSVLMNYADPPSVAETRAKIKTLVESNPDFCSAMDVSKKCIDSVHKEALYTKNGKVRRYGAWGEFWHMPALVITLGVDIISLSHNNHVSYYCSSGVNLYHPPQISVDE
eukprot:5774207-Prymnesium_polylepis.1